MKMTNWFENAHASCLRPLLAAALCLPALAQADWPPPSYTAVYDMYMDGKLRAETRATFTRQDQRWTFENRGQGTKGLARFLGVETEESAAGRWEGDDVLSGRFSHRSKVAVRKDRWSAEFDWEAGTVRVERDDLTMEYPLERGMVDPVGLTLAMQSLLNREQKEWELLVVEDEELDPQKFRALDPAKLQTAIGCLGAIEVERVRENSKRYSSVWFAPELEHITVRMVHGKRGGNEFELRIRTLSIGGDDVKFDTVCEGDQGP